MKYLITGGCGFLGSNLAQEVLNRGEELAVFDNLSRVGSSKNLEWLQSLGEFRFYPGDIRNQGDVERVCKEFQPDVVFHLAGQVAMTTSVRYPRMDFEINALGTLNILEAARQYAPSSVIAYSSTNKVYGDLEEYEYVEGETRFTCPRFPRGFNELEPLNFHTPYGCSKGTADQYVLDYSRMFGLKTVVCRHSSIYGDRQFSTVDQGWIGWFCQMASEMKNGRTEPFEISGKGKQVRDVLHAEDAVRCYFSLVENIDKTRGEAFNIGGSMENSLSLLELFQLLERMVGCKMLYTQKPMRMSDQKIFVADIEKIKRACGWAPRISVEEGLRRMVLWQNKIDAALCP